MLNSNRQPFNLINSIYYSSPFFYTKVSLELKWFYFQTRELLIRVVQNCSLNCLMCKTWGPHKVKKILIWKYTHTEIDVTVNAFIPWYYLHVKHVSTDMKTPSQVKVFWSAPLHINPWLNRQNICGFASMPSSEIKKFWPHQTLPVRSRSLCGAEQIRNPQLGKMIWNMNLFTKTSFIWYALLL